MLAKSVQEVKNKTLLREFFKKLEREKEDVNNSYVNNSLCSITRNTVDHF